VPSLKNENRTSKTNRKTTFVSQKIFGFAGWSGSGKTTLIEQVISNLRARGVRVSLVKHAHHAFDVDQPGKDSHRHRVAGASEVLITSANRYALMHELRGETELTLEDAVARLSPCDLVLIEGFKRAPIPKLEIWRAELGKPLLFPTDTHILAIATDDSLPAGLVEPNGRRFGLTETAEIAQFALDSGAKL
jgi:molybdopterin-guanine dinucleotide biosynthesis adapter protein